MSVVELIESAEFLVDAQGNKKAVQVDLAVWEEIVALLEQMEEGLEVELAAWDTLSDEALINFETQLEAS
ncbi:MAG: hypothetical protein U0401_12260 [Anaerolineae bacterium]